MERYRIGPDTALYFVTFSVVEWLPVFITDVTFRIVTDSLTYCHRAKGLRINAYVIMPTHLHAIVFGAGFDSKRLQATLTDFRKFTGRQLSDVVCRVTPPPAEYSTGRTSPRYQFPACFADVLRAEASGDRQRRFWQEGRHPEAIESEWFWRQKLDYLHNNPTRKNLVRRDQDWPHSSALWYANDTQVPADVPLTRIEW